MTINEVLYTEENGRYIFPFQETLKSLKAGVKGLILCNPNNPLGNSIPKDEFIELLQKTKKLDIPLIVDEAYFEYSDVDATQYLSKYKNLIILRTFSKAFGLSGMRLGYVIADTEILHEMDKLKLAWSVNHCAVHAGITVLGEIPYFKKKIREQKKIKNELYKVLSAQGIQCYTTDTNFLICKDPNYSDTISRLNESGILINDVSHYPYSGTLLKNAFRINVPSRDDLDLLSHIL
jgi:histidinol-phosphate aminotransferase